MRGFLMSFFVLLTASCAADSFRGADTAQQSVDRRPDAFLLQPAAQPEPRIELHYGEGACAPRLADGTLGTCINNRPCNGFGFSNPRGQIVCACYQTVGGCDDDSVCSIRKRSCVRQADIDLQRPPAP